MKTVVSKPSDPISVVSFLSNFKSACDSNIIHEGAAILLVSYFSWKPANAALWHPLIADKKSHQQRDRLTTYCYVVNYLFKTYGTNNFIAEAEVEILNFKEPFEMFAVQYFQALREKAIWCGMVYNKQILNTIFTEGLHTFNRYSLCTYWGANRNATLQNLARHATSLVTSREKTEVSTSFTRDKTENPLKSLKSSRVPSKITPVMT